MNKEKSLEQFKKNINLMFENNDKEIYLNKDDALKIEYYIYSLEQQCKQQKEVIDMFLNIVNKSKMLLNNPGLLDLYFKIKRCQNEYKLFKK